MFKKPFDSALIFAANLTAESKNSATLAKSSSTNPREVRAGVPESPKASKLFQSIEIIQGHNIFLKI